MTLIALQLSVFSVFYIFISFKLKEALFSRRNICEFLHVILAERFANWSSLHLGTESWWQTQETQAASSSPPVSLHSLRGPQRFTAVMQRGNIFRRLLWISNAASIWWLVDDRHRPGFETGPGFELTNLDPVTVSEGLSLDTTGSLW